MNFLTDVITYIRRIIKSPSDAVISDSLIIDYINRFWIMDVDARIQLFDLKTKYQFQTTPGVDLYNMPLYSVQTELGNQQIGMYPVYQGFMSPCYINGVRISFSTQRYEFYNMWPNVPQYSQIVGTGDGTNGPYTLSFSISPQNSTPVNNPVESLVRGHVDMAGIIATGNNVDPPLNVTLSTGTIPSTSIQPAVYFTTSSSTGANMTVCDSGQFLNTNVNLGLLMQPGSAPFGYTSLPNGYSSTQNVINYLTGIASNVYFPSAVPSGINIIGQCYFYQTGLPRSALFYNNTITLRTVPDSQYLVELDAYLTPAAFLATSAAVPYAYMSEYIARGAARKILADTGDIEQFQFYEPLFKEQEMLVWKRSQRQFTSTRTQTIYSQGLNSTQTGFINGAGYTS